LLKIPTGVGRLDSLLAGGWVVGRANIIYGPPASLKTSICVSTAKLFSSRGGVVFYLDTEGKLNPFTLSGIVHHDCSDVSTLLEKLAEVNARLRYLTPSLVLVVVDSVSAAFHSLYLANPGYAREKHSVFSHFINSVTSQGATALLTSWMLRGEYFGRALDPALVLRTGRRAGKTLSVYLEKSVDTLVGEEVLDVEEVVNASLQRFP
jgi:RecA/RadA recombinase